MLGKAVLFLSIFLSFNINADFNGRWVGKGYYYTHKSEGPCREVFFELSETQDSFNIVTGGYTCSLVSAEYPESSFEKKGNDIFYNGEKVGEKSDNEINISYYDGIYRLQLILEDNKIIFKEVWEDNGDSLVIKSHLSRL